MMKNQPGIFLFRKILLFQFICFCFVQNIKAQCECTNCPLYLFHIGVTEAYLNVSGAVSDTLNGTSQFVTSVKINVLHDAIMDCDITLIAPNGSSVLLSANDGSNIENEVTYQICFLDCTGTPEPDPGFPQIFDPQAGYVSHTTYYGSYYATNQNCLSTLSGDVIGLWTLRFEDFVPIDGGLLWDWSIEFNENDGTGCSAVCALPACVANENIMVNLPMQTNYCVNDPDLDFDISVVFDPSPPDPNLFSYTFLLINRANNVTLEYSPDTDFSDLPPGQYSICGLLYLTADESNLPPINGTDLFFDIIAAINSGIICAEFSDNCFNFTIFVSSPPPDFLVLTNCGLSGILEIVNPISNAIYEWALISGPGSLTFGSPISQSTTFQATVAGTYMVQISGSLNGCTSINTITLELQSEFFISDLSFDCLNSNGYEVSFTINGGLPPYFVNNNMIVGNIYTSTNIPYGTGFNFLITDSQDCSEIVSGVESCPCVSEAGLGSSTMIAFCEDEIAIGQQVSGEFLDGNDIGLYVLHNNPGNILGTIYGTSAFPDFAFNPTMQYGIVYYISFVVGNEIGGTFDMTDPCLSVSIGQPVIFYQNPVPSAGNDIQTCEFTFELEVFNGVVGSSIMWNLLVGGTNLIIDVPDQPNTNATASGPGTYQIELIETNGVCVGTDIINIIIFDPLLISNKTILCDTASENYTVSIDISGGNDPFSVNGVLLSGSTFTSPPIPSGNTYSFEITDNINCVTLEEGIHDCNCFTEAGTMAQDVLIVCAEGGSVTATYNQDGVLDPNDSGIYILHTSLNNILGTVLASNTTGIFTYDPSLLLDTRYYISYVIGNEINGEVDLNDPCLGVAPGQPVIFRSNPIADINPVDEVCGLSHIFSVNPTANTQYVWTTSSSEITIENQTATSTNISAGTSGTYEIILTATNDVCSAVDTVLVAFKQPVLVDNILYTCASDFNSFSAEVTFLGEPPFVSNLASTSISSHILHFESLISATSTSVEITSGNGCSTTILLNYDCLCQSQTGTMSDEVLTVCGNDEVQALYNFDGNPGDVDSFVYILHTSPTNILGTVLGSAPDGRFSKLPAMDFNTTYYISYVTVNFINGNYVLDPCSFIVPGQPVVFYEYPTLMWDITEALCEPSAGFIMTTNGIPGKIEVITSPVDATITGLSLSGMNSNIPGMYTVRVEVDNFGCLTIFTETFELFDAPVIQNITTECSGLEFTTSFEVTGGTPPYFLNGNIPITSPYESDKFASLTNFAFFIEDSRGCATASETTTKECNCSTDAGSLDAGNTTLCEGENYNPVFPDNYTLDTGDGFIYYLHDGSADSIGIIILETQTFPIIYNSSYAGQQFFITRVVGKILPGGNIDLTDECTDVTEGVSVSWSQKPDINVVLEPFYCEDSDIVLNIENVVNGQLDIFINQTNPVTLNPGINAITLDNSNVKKGDLLTYTFTDDVGCVYDIGSAILDIRLRPNAGFSIGDFESCINIETTISLPDLLNEEDPGGLWFLGDFGNEITAEITIDMSFTQNTAIFYLVENECGEDTSVIYILRRPVPEFDIVPVNPNCFGENDGSLTIISGTPDQNIVYNVNGNPTQDLIIEDLPSGSYTIMATNQFGCITEGVVFLTEAVQLTLDVGLDLLLEEGEDSEIIANTNIHLDSIQTTTWTLPDGQILSGRFFSIPITGTTAGQVTLVITDINGCTVSDFLLIIIKEKEFIFELPNVLLKGSSTNGFFTVPANTGILQVNDCSIYDRWGNKVFSVENVQPGSFSWDGSFNGTECLDGVYVYRLSLLLADGKEKTYYGDITVLK